MALVALSVVEQRLDAVRAVSGGGVGDRGRRVRLGCSRQTRASVGGSVSELSGWPGWRTGRIGRGRVRTRSGGPEVEAWVAEMRREHPRWGARRIRLELLHAARRCAGAWRVPAVRTINRILRRQGLLGRGLGSGPGLVYRGSNVQAPMQLWGIDIVGGVRLVDARTGEMRDAKVVTGVDDHSRYCVMAQVVERATGRAVCLAFAARWPGSGCRRR